MEHYRKGDRVKHKVFGRGTVRYCLSDVAVIQFDRLDTLRNIRKEYEGMKKVTGGKK